MLRCSNATLKTTFQGNRAPLSQEQMQSKSQRVQDDAIQHQTNDKTTSSCSIKMGLPMNGRDKLAAGTGN